MIAKIILLIQGNKFLRQLKANQISSEYGYKIVTNYLTKLIVINHFFTFFAT